MCVKKIYIYCVNPFSLYTTKILLFSFLTIKCQVKSLYLSNISIYLVTIIFIMNQETNAFYIVTKGIKSMLHVHKSLCTYN